MRILLGHGAKAVACDDYGRTALHYAAWEGNEELIGMLLDADASCASVTALDGDTPHYYAVQGGHQGAIDLLCIRPAQSESSID